jgi:dTDP-4-amino-4,6-dideoxygalactose transaminase
MRETFLPYYRPATTQAEIDAVVESIQNGWLTTGPKVREFEDAFARAAGVKHAVALNSCTAALHVGLIAAGVGPGDEVVMPSLTFVAGAQCTLEAGATPVFCDVDPDTLSVTTETIAQVLSPRTKAIIVMPYGGRPLGISDVVRFARERGIAIIEDAAHAAGMLDRGEWAGVHSDLAAYSFYATKNLTTAEGGMLLTNDDAVMERVRILSLHGMDRDAWKRYTQRGTWRYEVKEPGFKYNMPDIAASMGLVQLQRLPEMQDERDRLAQRYMDGLREIRGIRTQTLPPHPLDRHSWCMFAVRVMPEFGIRRDELIDQLKNLNIGTSVHYIPTHHFSGYRRFASDKLRATDEIAQQILSFPLFPGMTDRDVDDVLQAVESCAKQPGVSLAS